MDPAIPMYGIQKFSIMGIANVYKLSPYQNTGFGIALDPHGSTAETYFFNYPTNFAEYWANGDIYKNGTLLGTIDGWNTGNVVTLVVDMDLREFWWELDKVKVSSINSLHLPQGKRVNVHFWVSSHYPNAEVELFDYY